ncbi:hypothetical protein F383_28440 [Gossypium arboreum]|uniref:Uncharacterized protein n=1 Tax=Gossypium arboreum TaxID=29729 RepID=A0A0B0MSL4_GOSAR|nr:hypothetical protein F383_28440 [Gossypium arboreum]
MANHTTVCPAVCPSKWPHTVVCQAVPKL